MAREPGAEREFLFTDDDFALIVTLVREHTGIKLADHKRNMVYGRLARRLRELRLKSFKDYCRLLDQEGGEQELIHFVNAITTNLTGFFREPHHFDHLADLLKEKMIHPPKNKRLRLWSAACSSGQEPYTMAMTVREAMKGANGWDVKILATDIDTNMVGTAQKGVYAADIVEKIPDHYRKAYTVSKSPEDKEYEMHTSLKELITFKQLNLLKEWPMKGPFDVIFCRNVVIYFDKETQAKLFNRMADLMAPDGVLYIGHSESLFNVCDRFELIGRTTYRKKQ